MGAHTAPFLLKTAESDVYHFQPDLLVFQAYDEPSGHWESYGALLDRVRERTCADILMVGNHLTSDDVLDEASRTNGVPVEFWPGLSAADYVYLPAIARRTGACWADIRTPWKAYLVATGTEPWRLRADFVHLNEAGIALLLDLLRPYVEPEVFAPPVAPYACGRVTRWRVGGRENLEFEGNRLLLATAPEGVRSSIACRVDGRKPSVLRELYVHGRTSPWPGALLPALLKVESVTVPVIEDWTLTVDEVLEKRRFTFRLAGSVTGPDGEGRSDLDFTSRSGRVRVLSADWYWEAPLFSGNVRPGMQVQWATRFYGRDEVHSGDGEGWVEIANGLADGPHTLQLDLLSGTRESFPELLVYHPAGSEPGGAPDSAVRHLARDGRLVLRWPVEGGSVGSSSTDLRDWKALAEPDILFGRGQVEVRTEGAQKFFMLRPEQNP